jgi:hypothetical protein
MYSSKSVKLDFQNVIGYTGGGLPISEYLDVYSTSLASAFTTGGWTVTTVISYFDYTTNGDIQSFVFALPSPGNVASWDVQDQNNAAAPITIIDAEFGHFTLSALTRPSNWDANGIPADLTLSQVASTSAGWEFMMGRKVIKLPAPPTRLYLHYAVMGSLLVLRPTWTLEQPIAVVSGANYVTRVFQNVISNYIPDPVTPSISGNFSTGGVLRSSHNVPAHGGYLAKSAASTRTFNTGTVGTDNHITLYWTIRPFGAVRSWCMAAAKQSVWASVAHPSYVSLSQTSNFATPANFGISKGSPITTQGFINPHQAIIHSSTPLESMLFSAHAGGLKLMDFRTDRTLPPEWNEAAWAAIGGNNFRQGFQALTGQIYLSLSGPSFSRITASGTSGLTGGVGSPRLITYTPARIAGSVNGTGVIWQSGDAEFFEPWFAFNPYFSGTATNNLNQEPPILGQLWDMVGVARATTDPDSFTVSWDDETWQPYTINTATTNNAPFTLCGRVTEIFTG